MGNEAPPTELPVTPGATFCATLVDQWVREGLSDAFIAPGSRSTPLALALVRHESVSCHIFHDERSASFAALGHGLATGRPAVVLCSSGTAATHFHAAVVEADASDVPMLVCTADRPPELWGIGAPQTINQTELYGGAVRSFFEPGPPGDGDPAFWRPLAHNSWSAAVGDATTALPGPVHLNLSFRDPLTGVPGPLPQPLSPKWSAENDVAEVDPGLHEAAIDAVLNASSGVIIAGRSAADGASVRGLAERLGWPLLADHRSAARAPGVALQHFDALLRSPDFADAQRPQVILRLGEPLASKVLSQWISNCAADGATVIAATTHGKRIDPERVATSTVPIASFVERLSASMAAEHVKSSAAKEWLVADRAAAERISSTIAAAPELTEPEVARRTVASVPTGGALVVASSMPIRDVEWYAPNRNDISCFANRGANGIDGVISTAIGVALTGMPTTLLIGDVAFLHDSTALTALRDRDLDLTIVVTDNDGGAIFSFLPQHALLSPEEYELLFGTPHGTDLASLVRAHGIREMPWPRDPDASADAQQDLLSPDGVRVVIATTDRERNLTLHASLR